MPGEPATDDPPALTVPTGPARAVVTAGAAVLVFGCAVGFGWTMVRFPRFRGTQPVPSWVAWSAVALCLAGLVAVIGTLTFARVARVATSLSAADRGADGTGEPGATTSHIGPGGPVASRSLAVVGVFGLFAAGLAVPAIAATESTARWDPLLLAVVLPVAALVVHRWTSRRGR